MAGDPDSSGRVDSTPMFDGCYYARSCGRPYARDEHWLKFFGGIGARIASDIQPRRVLDAGCALGLLVEALRERQIDAFGIDVSEFAIEHVHEAVKPFCRQASVTEPLNEHYDLIVCIEVVEHMAAADAELAIANFCAHSRDILFSSSPTDFRESTHFNVQPPEHWAALFARHGFFRDVDFDASFITSWAVRFRHRADPFHRIVADYERTFARNVFEKNELRAHAVNTQAEISGLSGDRDQAQAAARTALSQLADAESRLADAQARLTALQTGLEHARTTVDNMKRSWFWRARAPWAWLSRR